MNILSDFTGGMSQDDNLLGKGQCIYQEGIDTLSSPGELRLMPPVEYTTLYGYETTSFFSPEGDVIWYGTGDGKIRRQGTDAEVLDTGDVRDVIDGIRFLDDFYTFSNRYVFKTIYNKTFMTGPSTFFDHGQAYGFAHPVVYLGNILFFGSNNTVQYVDSTLVYQTLLTLQSNVRGLSISGNYLRIYTENTLVIVDIGTKTATYAQSLPFVPNGVTSDGVVDYVTTAGAELYVCSGLEWNKIAGLTKSELMDSASIVPYKYAFASSENAKKIYFADGNLLTIDYLSNRALMYGSKMNGLPKAFQYLPDYDSQSIPQGNSYPISAYSAVFAKNGIVYVGYKVGDDFRNGKINFLSRISACFSGTYITRNYDFGDYSIIKSIDEIRVGKTGVNGELWCSIDGGNFQLIGNLDQNDLEQKFMTYKKDFREVSFMIKLFSDFDVVKNLDLRFNQRQV